MTDSQPPFEGVAITVGGRTLVLPPLSFGYLRRNADKFTGLAGANDASAVMDTMIEMAHAALSRNYPEMTLEEVGELLDSNTSKVIFEALKQVSGFVSGEAPPGAATTNP